MTKEDVYAILRRWWAGQHVSGIAEVENCDRKTIRKYIQKFKEAGFWIDKKLPAQDEIWETIATKILPAVERHRPACKQLEPFQGVIREMIHDPKEPLKPKSAFLVVKAKFDLDVSYETFKNFVRDKGLAKKPLKQMIRIELPPGLETQIDYGKV